LINVPTKKKRKKREKEPQCRNLEFLFLILKNRNFYYSIYEDFLAKKEEKSLNLQPFFCFFLFVFFSLKISQQVPNFTPEKKRKKAAPNPTLGDICEEVMGAFIRILLG
jgi:hypothetical protein